MSIRNREGYKGVNGYFTYYFTSFICAGLHENKSLAKRRNEALNNRIGECFNNNSKGVEPIFQLSHPCGGTFFARVSPAKPFQLSHPLRGVTCVLERSL